MRLHRDITKSAALAFLAGLACAGTAVGQPLGDANSSRYGARVQPVGGSVTITNKTAQSFRITPYGDGLLRNKYVVHAPDSSINYWYASTGSANSLDSNSAVNSNVETDEKQWCRVRYLYNDSVRVPECAQSFMYSSHLITGLNGQHYELWFSPSSLSYFKIRNQTTDTWYAHDGSVNEGHSGRRTTKDDWCNVIIYHMTGIVGVPKACEARLKAVMNVAAGRASLSEHNAEVQALRVLMEVSDNTLKYGEVLEGAMKLSGGALKGFVVGEAVSMGTDAVKEELGLTASYGSASEISAEVLTTTAVNTGVSTLVMSMAGASFSPAAVGVGFLVSGAIAGAEVIFEASADTALVMLPGYENHPRYNRDLNGLTNKLVDGVATPQHDTAPLALASSLNKSGPPLVLPKTWRHLNPDRTVVVTEATPDEELPAVKPLRQKINALLARIQGSINDESNAGTRGTIAVIEGQIQTAKNKGVGRVPAVTEVVSTPVFSVGDRYAIKSSASSWSGRGPTAKLLKLNDAGTAFDESALRIQAANGIVSSPATILDIGGTAAEPWIALGASGAVFLTSNGVFGLDDKHVSDVGEGWMISNEITTGGFKIYRYDRSNASGRVQRSQNTIRGAWINQAGGAVRIGGSYFNPWIATDAGRVFELDESTGAWNERSGILASDVGEGWAISTAASETDGVAKLYRYRIWDQAWIAVPPVSASPAALVSIGGTADRPVVVDVNGKVYQAN